MLGRWSKQVVYLGLVIWSPCLKQDVKQKKRSERRFTKRRPERLNPISLKDHAHLTASTSWFGIYRATLWVYAVFAVVWCPSVCPSVCPGRSCIVARRLRTLTEDIVKLLSQPGSPITLVFFIPIADTQFHGELYTRGWENLWFSTENRRLSRKRYDMGPWLL